MVARFENCEKKNRKGARFSAFAILFAILFFLTTISSICLVSSEFKNQVVKTFSSAIKGDFEVGNYFSNLFTGEKVFKEEYEIDLPCNCNYSVIENALVFDISSMQILYSCESGEVVDVASISQKEIAYCVGELEFHYIFTGAMIVCKGDCLAKNTKLAVVDENTKLYFYVLKNKERQNLKVVQNKVVIILS